PRRRAPSSSARGSSVSTIVEKCNSARVSRNPAVTAAFLWNRPACSISVANGTTISRMDDRTSEAALSLTKFGIGQPVRRTDDPVLVRGQGRYADDVSLPRQAYAVMVRSRDAHGIIRSIDTAAAKAMPGVLAVLSAEDLKAYGGLKCSMPLKSRDGSPMKY